MVTDCGLSIELEKILPIEDMVMTKIVKQKITNNYSAVVSEIQHD